MTQSAASSRFLGSSVASRIAESFDTSPKLIHVSMKGRDAVSCIFKQVQKAQEQAHEKPRAVK